MKFLDDIKHTVVFWIGIYIPVRMVELLFGLLVLCNSPINPLMILVIQAIGYFIMGMVMIRILEFDIKKQDIINTIVVGIVFCMIPYIVSGNEIYIKTYRDIFCIADIFCGHHILDAYISEFCGKFIEAAFIKYMVSHISCLIYSMILLTIPSICIKNNIISRR